MKILLLWTNQLIFRSETANSILKSLIEKKDITVIMVSHNRSFSKFFNRTLEIKDSKVLEL